MPNLHSACIDQINKIVLDFSLHFYFVVYLEILCAKTFSQLTYRFPGRIWGLGCLGAVLTQSPVVKQSFIERTTWAQQISLFSPLSPHSSNNDLSKVRGLHIQQMCLSALYKSTLPSLDWILSPLCPENTTSHRATGFQFFALSLSGIWILVLKYIFAPSVSQPSDHSDPSPFGSGWGTIHLRYTAWWLSWKLGSVSP